MHNSCYLITAKCLTNISWKKSCQTVKLIEEHGVFMNIIFGCIIQMDSFLPKVSFLLSNTVDDQIT